MLLLCVLCILCVLCACGTSDTASPSAATFTWRATITDTATGAAVTGTIYVDDVQAAANVTTADVAVPADGQKHALRVESTGYQSWKIEIAGETRPGRVLLGPVKLLKD